MAIQLKTAKSFLDRVLEKVPEAEREGLRADYSRAQDEIDGVQSELDTAMGKVRATATAQNQWWEGNKDAVHERDTLKKQLEGAPKGGMEVGEIEKRLTAQKDEVLSMGLGLITTASTISARHLKEFDEPLDMQKLADEAVKANMTLQGYYDQHVGPRRQERTEAANKLAIANAREEGKREGLSEGIKRAGDGMPYPVGAAPTTLAGLKKPAEGAANPFSLEAAVETANKTLAGAH